MAINILVVDDSSVMRAMIIKTMKMSDVSVGDIHQAANGQEGLEALDKNWIDLVLLDINMPVMNGEEMVERMKEDPEMKGIPVLVVSTEGSKSRIERLEEKGIKFIHKPFSPEEVQEAINSILGTGDNNGSTA